MPRKKKHPTTFNPPPGWNMPANEAFRKRIAEDPEFRKKKCEDMAKARAAKKPREGLPFGMSREQYALEMRRAKRKADKLIELMKDEGILPDVIIPNDDVDKADKALHETCLLAFGPGTKKDKLAALKVVLEYTRAKPETKSKVTLNKSEDFLAAIAKEIEDGK